MAMALLVPSPPADAAVLVPGMAGRLAELGITRISLLQDQTGIAVMLEGWAFDPARIDEAVRAIFPDGSHRVRILHELEHVAVNPAPEGRRT